MERETKGKETHPPSADISASEAMPISGWLHQTPMRKNKKFVFYCNLKFNTKRKKLSKDLRQKIVDKQENTCGSCKLALTPYFQIDHTVGLQFGGMDEESNLMALCCECHAMKSIAENQCRKQIQEAIQTILTDKLGQRGYSSMMRQ